MPRTTDLDRLRADRARAEADIVGRLPDEKRRDLEGWVDRLAEYIEELERDED